MSPPRPILDAVKYLPWKLSQDFPFCRWFARDGCRCTVDREKSTSAIARDAGVVLAATVEALETICLSVPYLTEQLGELSRRAAEAGLQDDAFEALSPWRDERIGFLGDDALGALSHARKIDDALRTLQHLRHFQAAEPQTADGEFVYLVGADRYLKIGFSTNPKVRLAKMQTGLPLELTIVGIVRAPRELEQQLHRRFAKYRHRGEWYQDVSDIRAFFRTHPARIET